MKNNISPAATTDSSYGSPGRVMQVLANGDIVDCGRLPQTARNNLYKTELCKHFNETGACRYGSKCQFAHGEEELRGVLRHPKYKTTRCKAFISTGKCMYASRCRFIHSNLPEDDLTDGISSTASESDDQDQLKDLLTNPYGDGLDAIDLSVPFGGLKQMTLQPLSALGGNSFDSPPPSSFDSYLFTEPFPEFKFNDQPTSDGSVISMSSSSGTLDAFSPTKDGDSTAAKFSRLSIFQRICREEGQALTP